MPISATL